MVIVGIISFLCSPVFAVPTCTGQFFCLTDLFNTSGNATIQICGGDGSLYNRSFNFWYNASTLIGPLNLSTGVASAVYANDSSTVYRDAEGITRNTPCVDFVLDNTQAPFTSNVTTVNATAFNKTNYVQAAYQECNPPNSGYCNGTAFTANYVYIETKDSASNARLGNVVLMPFNNATKSFALSEPAVTDSSGYWAEHCEGFRNVTTNICQSFTSGQPSTCRTHGTQFYGQGRNCSIASTTTTYAIHVISANTSQQNVTPATPLIINLSTPTAMSMIMAFDWNPDNQQSMQSLSVSQFNVSDYNTNEFLFNISSQGGQGGPGGEGGGGGPPAFLQPNRVYKITFSSAGATYNYPFMAPSVGMTGAQIIVANSTPFPSSTGYRTVVGKVVNESGNAVSGATVYAQFFKGPGGAFGIMLFNSSITDSNGVFTMRVPRSRAPSENPQMGNMYFPMYQFFIVSNITSSAGVSMYFPTIDNNNNRGFFAIGDTVVLPPLTLKSGGQVNVNITLNGITLVMSELSKFLTLGTGISRTAVAGKFTMTSVFGSVTPPAAITTSLLSPTGSAIVNLFGKNVTMQDPTRGSIVGTCINTSATVTQGVASSITCSLAQPGYLNLTVWTCSDVFDTSSGCNMQMPAGSFSFWFEQNGILRNTSGDAVSYINPEGIMLENLVGFSGNTPNLTIPLPAGTYTFELVPAFSEYSRYLSVYNTTTFTISAGNTMNLNLTRGNSWNINPMFNPSLTFSGSNSINLSVMKQNNPNPLNTSYISLNGSKILFLNRSEAVSGKTILFGYDTSKKIFYNTTFNPSSFGLSAGKYLIFFNATNVTNNVAYSSTFTMPINVFDFQVGIDLGGFTFGTGQIVSGRIFAFNSTGAIPANTTPITVEVKDTTGASISTSANLSSVSNGIGTINISMPSNQGFYEISISVNASGKYGVATNWVQISNFAIKTTTDRYGYQPTDNVILTVQVLNASTSAAISGASIQAVVDTKDTPATGVTGSDGKITLTLSPSTHFDSSTGSWTFGWHTLKIKISKSVGTDVFNLETWSGFDVRGVDLFVRPDKPSYQTGDNVTIMIYGPLETFTVPKSGVEVDGTALTECFYDDGSCSSAQFVPGVHFHINDAWSSSSKMIELRNWSVGHHDVEITVSAGGGEQKIYTGFDVSLYKIIASTDSFSYNLNQDVTLNVKVTYPNSSALSSQNVNATLYKAQSPNDIPVNITNGTTNSTGQVELKLNATQPGFNYLKINVSNQLYYIGLQVSSVKVTLLNSPGGSVVSNFNVAPGDTVWIYVNATSNNVNVPDNSAVKAKIRAFGNVIDLPSNTTISGNSTIGFQIPSFAPSQTYGLEITVTTPNGEQGFAPIATLTVTGGSALQLRITADRSFSNPYKNSDTALFTATLSYPNGSGANGYNITFEVGSEGTKPQSAGNAITASGGVATKTFAITTNHTEGPYYLHAFITNSTDIQAYSGFLVSGLYVNVTTDSTTYSPGQNITVSVTITNRTTGSQVNATSGFVFVFNKEKGEIQQSVTTSGQSQPYRVNVTVSNETSAIGTYQIGVLMYRNQSQGLGFALVDVRNTSQSLNLTLPTITAGTSFLANLTSSLTGTGTLKVFSPTATALVYENTSVSLTANQNTSVNVTISSPGIYIFNAFLPAIGATTQIVVVNLTATGTTMPAVWTGTSTTANATTFTTAQNVVIMSNKANSTATILAIDTTTNTTMSVSLPLTQNTSSTYYGTFSSSNLVSGRNYFIRLDTSTGTGIANTMFRVS